MKEAQGKMIPELLDRGSASRLAVAVAGEGVALTYDQLRQQVDSVAAKLDELGISRGDRVALALPNNLEILVSFLAASMAGTAAPLNPNYKLDEFRFYLADTGARALIVPRGGAPEARIAAAETHALVIEADLDTDGQVHLQTVAPGALSKSSVKPNTEDIALVLHTSGTTSRPKRVPLSHANVIASARTVAGTYGLTPDDVSLCVMPLFHVHGLVASALATLATGGTLVLVPRFNPLSFWRAVREHRVTWYSAVPTIHQLLLSRARAGDKRPEGAEHLRFVRSCSAALSPQMMAEVEERFGVPVVEAYGMTEAAHQMASNPLPPGARLPGSVGRATGVEIAVLDEKGGVLPVGTKGEVSIKGSNVFDGYEDNPAANASAFAGGWFRTGDEGHLNRDGYLTLVGRIKELINRGGEKIAPREIDEALVAHPSVAEAVCFGIDDRFYGEEVAAAVVLNSPATEAELVAHCKTLLADFKCPKAIYIVETIPRTATGKIQRRLVAAAMTAPRG